MSQSDIVDAYYATRSIKAVAREYGMSEQRARKILITARAIDHPNTRRIAILRDAGLTLEEVAVRMGMSMNVLNSYQPYQRGRYGYRQTATALYQQRRRAQKKSAEPADGTVPSTDDSKLET